MHSYFPAGLVSRKQKEKVEDLEWKKSFIAKVKKYNKPIYPVHIVDRIQNDFIEQQIRKKMGIKINLEMLLLADEMFKQQGSTIHLTMGNPFYQMYLTKQNLTRMGTIYKTSYLRIRKQS